MTRMIIAFEGREVVPFQNLEVGSLKWEEPIPVVKHPSPPNPSDVIGEATDIRREKDGSLTAEMSFDSQYDSLLDLVGATVFCTNVDGDQENGCWTSVRSAIIREIFLTVAVPWAGKKPGEEIDPDSWTAPGAIPKELK